MPNYDLNVILLPTLSEAQVQAEKDFIAAQIERYNGEITALDEWGNTRLAYPIQKHSNGYYLIYTLKLEGAETPKAIENAIRLRDNSMRALVVRDRPEWRTANKKKAAKKEAAPVAVETSPEA